MSTPDNADFLPVQSMDLLLWRHAEAEEGDDDLRRPLTERGQRQARSMGQWLRQHAPRELRILVSPAVRTQQTAAALNLPFTTVRSLGPSADVADLIAASEWPQAKAPVLIVGHQPTLGRLAALLLSGAEAPWSVRKGALWWLTRRWRQGEPQTVLRGVMSPEWIA